MGRLKQVSHRGSVKSRAYLDALRKLRPHDNGDEPLPALLEIGKEILKFCSEGVAGRGSEVADTEGNLTIWAKCIGSRAFVIPFKEWHAQSDSPINHNNVGVDTLGKSAFWTNFKVTIDRK